MNIEDCNCKCHVVGGILHAEACCLMSARYSWALAIYERLLKYNNLGRLWLSLEDAERIQRLKRNKYVSTPMLKPYIGHIGFVTDGYKISYLGMDPLIKEGVVLAGPMMGPSPLTALQWRLLDPNDTRKNSMGVKITSSGAL